MVVKLHYQRFFEPNSISPHWDLSKNPITDDLRFLVNFGKIAWGSAALKLPLQFKPASPLRLAPQPPPLRPIPMHPLAATLLVLMGAYEVYSNWRDSKTPAIDKPPEGKDVVQWIDDMKKFGLIAAEFTLLQQQIRLMDEWGLGVWNYEPKERLELLFAQAQTIAHDAGAPITSGALKMVASAGGIAETKPATDASSDTTEPLFQKYLEAIHNLPRSQQALLRIVLRHRSFSTDEDIAHYLVTRPSYLLENPSADTLTEVLSDLTAYIGHPPASGMTRTTTLHSHGTTSASLPGIVRNRALLPTGVAMAQKPCYVFDAEAGWGTAFNNSVNRLHVSLTQIDIHWAGGIKHSRIGWDNLYSNRRSGPIIFHEEPLQQYASESRQLGDHRRADELAKIISLIRDMIRNQASGMMSLNDNERLFVEDRFPIVFYIDRPDIDKLYPVTTTWPRHAKDTDKSEVAYRGNLDISSSVLTVFMPQAQIDRVRAYFGSWGIYHMVIHSIESLYTARQLLTE